MSVPQKLEIHENAKTIIVDSVTFCFDFQKGRIAPGHPSGPVLEIACAKIVVTDEQADELANAGVPDHRNKD
ncbi:MULTISPECIES: hypothetical protein [unclassified Halomonas]|jgi:hypothetical protein|uniref:hypothetical protein n=1 Tax=unclassified Halomonas TaxID=2609666 RepID=UPI001EF5B86D|nr:MULTISPECIES: hypothetical protein [unclassified Halomonas]MCG7576815.1 hypothetical protein [Halomonas sp. MMH1-48]MCG7603878.1 hypothetical protein [Halomonas sp. MM17-34]MCG7613128.1 hypothetical protein [Halomonas sp. MM17-29]MCG7619584.1 hypothetical protein [Halomonas sp. DSH1-27]